MSEDSGEAGRSRAPYLKVGNMFEVKFLGLKLKPRVQRCQHDLCFIKGGDVRSDNNTCLGRGAAEGREKGKKCCVCGADGARESGYVNQGQNLEIPGADEK